MKNILKRFFVAVLVIAMTIPSLGSVKVYNPNAYDINNILQTIKEITTKDFNGRAAGTPYGKKTEDYFAARFKEIGLKPSGDNGTYLQAFDGTRGDTDSPYVLEVLDGSNVLKSYIYGTDFKFLYRYNNSGDITASGKVVDEISQDMPKASGEIAFLTSLNIPKGATPQPFIDLANAGYSGCIVLGGDTLNRIKGASGYFDNSIASKLPRVSVSKPVYAELLDYSDKGYKIHLQTNFVVTNFSANNVIGVIKAAKPTDDCLIISGHMDHITPDPDGAYFPGALDNASGSSSVIEIARAIKKQNIKPNINLVFIAFSGEEEFSLGSAQYVKTPLYPLKNTININLDGLGGIISGQQDGPIWIATSENSKGNKKTTELIEEIESEIMVLNYDYRSGIDDSSDHTSFAQCGVPSVTLMDMEDVPFHVPADNIDNIGVPNLTRDVKVVMNMIGKLAFTPAQNAVPLSSKVVVNGKTVTFDAYNINGSNYFKLRDLAMAVKGTKKQFEINFDNEKNTLNVITNKAYTPIGDELKAPAKRIAKAAKQIILKVYVNDKEDMFTIYSIDGENYFDLKDIAKVINFGITYNSKTNIINIKTSASYTK